MRDSLQSGIESVFRGEVWNDNCVEAACGAKSLDSRVQCNHFGFVFRADSIAYIVASFQHSKKDAETNQAASTSDENCGRHRCVHCSPNESAGKRKKRGRCVAEMEPTVLRRAKWPFFIIRISFKCCRLVGNITTSTGTVLMPISHQGRVPANTQVESS